MEGDVSGAVSPFLPFEYPQSFAGVILAAGVLFFDCILQNPAGSKGEKRQSEEATSSLQFVSNKGAR